MRDNVPDTISTEKKLPSVRVGITDIHARPKYTTLAASGADIYARLPSEVELSPMETVLIPTGMVLEIPPGYEAQIRPRSGWALTHGVTVLNSPGTIDADFRGEVKVLIINYGKKPVCIRNRDRIAQLVIAPVLRAEFYQITLSETERSVEGFGSSGMR